MRKIRFLKKNDVYSKGPIFTRFRIDNWWMLDRIARPAYLYICCRERPREKPPRSISAVISRYYSVDWYGASVERANRGAHIMTQRIHFMLPPESSERRVLSVGYLNYIRIFSIQPNDELFHTRFRVVQMFLASVRVWSHTLPLHLL